MKFFLYVPGMAFDGDVVKQSGFSLGGSESMGYYIGQILAKAGHNVYIFCNLPTGSDPRTIDGVIYLPIGNMHQQAPFGDNFERYAMGIPHDVLLAQRHPGLFAKKYASKMNYWWTHDLALKRFQGNMNAQIWNTDKFLAVSEFHKEQVKNVYNIDEEYMDVLKNGIDLSLWPVDSINPEEKIESKTMLYSHRPERGLVNLVEENGIMEELFKIDPEIKLLVCSYDNTTQDMAGFYNFLYSRCELLPNVHNIGHLSKEQLAQVQRKCWLHVYPTEFEETSCITVMEEQAAGTPVVTTRAGALPETLKNSGVYWTDKNSFAKTILYLKENPSKWMQLHKKALEKRKIYDIETVGADFLQMVERDFEAKTQDKQRLFKHLFRTSDIQAATILADQCDIDASCIEERFNTIKDDLGQTVEFYEKTEKRNTDIGNKHGMDNPAGLLNMARLQPVIHQLQQLKSDAHVLDYGCCVGQVSFALKTMFPDMQFHCVDISKEQANVGKEYAKKNKIEGMAFNQCTDPSELREHLYDAVICLEVLEHIWDYHSFLIKLEKLAKSEVGKIVISTPLGPFDENSDDPDPLYQHLHNFEEQDIRDLVGHKADFDMMYIGEAPSKAGEQLGNYVWNWTVDEKLFGPIDYERKIKIQNPRQSVTACIMCGPESATLEKTLNSIAHFVDDIIIGVDDSDWWLDGVLNPERLTYIVAERHGAKTFPIESPLIQGFASARNNTIKRADGDWILWIDDDETLVWGDVLSKYMRSNLFDSYGLPQHHLSVDPVGVLKTDYPARLFRNRRGIKFYGIVHEHPEKIINEGAGKFFIIPDKQGAIMHNAYDTEETRRKRFMRNFPLMERDRKENPNRKLGMFLWIRDLAHMNRFEYEQSGQVSTAMISRAEEAIALWRKTLKDSNTRMLRDTMSYITECVDIITQGGGLYFRMALDVNNKGLGDAVEAPVDVIFSGKVENKMDLQSLFEVLMVEKVDSVESVNYI